MASPQVTLHRTTSKTLHLKNRPQDLKTWNCIRFQIISQTQAVKRAMILQINCSNLLLLIHSFFKKREQRISAMKSTRSTRITGSPSSQHVDFRRILNKCSTYNRKIIHIMRVWANRRNLNLLRSNIFQELIDGDSNGQNKPPNLNK